MNPVKPGIQTSEFWVALLVPAVGQIVVGVSEKYNLGIPQDSIYAAVATAVTFIINRAWVKGKVVQAEAAKAVATTTAQATVDAAAITPSPAISTPKEGEPV